MQHEKNGKRNTGWNWNLCIVCQQGKLIGHLKSSPSKVAHLRTSLWHKYNIKSAFTLGGRDSKVESPNTMLAI
jgi:hypothetical protein